MADEPLPTLDYAAPPKTLPPPNDAVGLPRREWLNQPARYAALVTVILPFALALLFAIQPLGRVAIGVGSVMLLLASMLDVALAVAALRALNYAGRVGAVLVVSLAVMLLAPLFGLWALIGLLFVLGR